VNERPPNEDNDVDELYRRASARDASRPSESVRRAVVRHAAELAARRAAQGGPIQSAPDQNALGARREELGPVKLDFKQPAANEWRWRPAAYGGLAAAALAGLLIAPHFLPPSPAPASALERRAKSAQALTAKPRAFADEASPNEQQGFTGGLTRSAAPAPSAGLQSAPAAPPAQAVGSTAVSAFAAVRPHAPIDSTSALRQAARGGDTSRLKALLDAQIDIDARDPGGRTALMLAVIGGQARAVDALLARGADPNAADSTGTTPLAAALAANHPDIAAALRRAGAH
jgi:hypothetical protein